MLGEPESGVAEPLAELSQVNGIAQRIACGRAGTDGGKVKD